MDLHIIIPLWSELPLWFKIIVICGFILATSVIASIVMFFGLMFFPSFVID